jgi:peptidylglycine monooxygenase
MSEHMEVACMMNESLVLHPLAYTVHTHKLGKVVSAYRVTPAGRWPLVGRRNPHNAQVFTTNL